MKKLILILLFVVSSYKPQPAYAAKLGPFSVDRKFCENVDAIAGVLNAFQMIQWPVIGMPGIVLGISQKTSVLLDLCKYIIQLEQLRGVEASFFVMDSLNQLTGNKWDEELQLTRDSWSLANSFHDFDGQGGSRGLDARRQAREVARWQRSYDAVSEKQATKRQADVNLQKYVQSTARGAMLKDMLKCPSPSSALDDSTYLDEILPQEERLETALGEYLYYERKLADIGMQFIISDSSYDEYKSDVSTIVSEMFSIQATQSTYQKDNWVKTNQRDKLGVYKKINEPIDVKYNEYRVVPKEELFSSFMLKWGNGWTMFAKREWAGHYAAIKNDQTAPEWLRWGQKTSIEEAEEVNISRKVPNYKIAATIISDCPSTSIGASFNKQSADYHQKLTLAIAECERGARVSAVGYERALQYHLTQLQNALQAYNNATAILWTAESKYLGVHRIDVAGYDPFGPESKGASCSNELSPIEITKVSAEIQAENNVQLAQINESLMKAEFRAKVKAEKEAKEEEEKARMIRRAEQEAGRYNQKSPSVPLRMRDSVFGKGSSAR